MAARRAGFGALALGTVFMTATTAILVALRHEIPMLFVGDQTDAAGTTNLAATLILVGATFFVTDGVQGIAAGALRPQRIGAERSRELSQRVKFTVTDVGGGQLTNLK